MYEFKILKIKKMQEQFRSKNFRKFENKFINSMSKHQSEYLNEMLDYDKLTICMPTGTGKSRIIQGDIIDNIKNETTDSFVIATHRLMLNTQHISELFEQLSIVLGSIGFIFVGSTDVDVDEFMKSTKINSKMNELNLNYKDLFLNSTNSFDIEKQIKKHKDADRDVIIVSTYHSLNSLKNIDIHTIYCDEAHLLATEKEKADFKSNFNTLNFKRSYFFTATPKDLKDSNNIDIDSFLMDNEDIFGKRIGLSFNEAIKCGYIVSPIIHIAQPENYDHTKDFETTDNYVKFIVDIYKSHKKWLNSVSFNSNMISPKLLIKNPSVDHIWKIHKRLIEHKDLQEVNIFAGASRNDLSTDKHMKNNEGIRNRNDFLKAMQDMDSKEEAIILHYDILSEGINVPGITGVVFLSDKLPTLPKLLQNTGRATRLHLYDRERLSNKSISVNDSSTWVKPHCAVILPILNAESNQTVKNISSNIKKLRDEFNFDPSFYVSLGEDISKSDKDDDDLETLNKKDKKEKPVLLEKIIHEIEKLDKEEKQDDYNHKLKLIGKIEDLDEKKKQYMELMEKIRN